MILRQLFAPPVLIERLRPEHFGAESRDVGQGTADRADRAKSCQDREFGSRGSAWLVSGRALAQNFSAIEGHCGNTNIILLYLRERGPNFVHQIIVGGTPGFRCAIGEEFQEFRVHKKRGFEADYGAERAVSTAVERKRVFLIENSAVQRRRSRPYNFLKFSKIIFLESYRDGCGL